MLLVRKVIGWITGITVILVFASSAVRFAITATLKKGSYSKEK